MTIQYDVATIETYPTYSSYIDKSAMALIVDWTSSSQAVWTGDGTIINGVEVTQCADLGNWKSKGHRFKFKVQINHTFTILRLACFSYL